METSAEEEQVQLSSDPKYLGLGFTVFGDKVQTGSQQSVISSNHLLAAFIKPYAIHGLRISSKYDTCIENRKSATTSNGWNGCSKSFMQTRCLKI